LTRRANQGYNNIIARTDKARAEKSAAGFLFAEIPIGRLPHVTTPHLPARSQSVGSPSSRPNLIHHHSPARAKVPVRGAALRPPPHAAPDRRGYGSRRKMIATAIMPHISLGKEHPMTAYLISLALIGLVAIAV